MTIFFRCGLIYLCLKSTKEVNVAMTESNQQHQTVSEKAGAIDERLPVLKWAWQRFANYDLNSQKLKKSFRRSQWWVLLLGSVATLLVLTQSQLKTSGVIGTDAFYDKAFQYTIVALPIIISIFIAAGNRFKPGIKSILLRAGAEGIKREIYRYRVSLKIPQQPGEKDAPTMDETLTRQINGLNNQLMQSELKTEVLKSFEGDLPPAFSTAPEDDGFSPLTADEYLKYRVVNQLNFYERKTRRLDRQLVVFHWLIYIFGGFGTLLAAVNLELWVALTTSLVAMFTTHLEYRQTENTIMLYNQASASLEEIKSGWDVTPPAQKQIKANILELVCKAEDALTAEHGKWVRQMEEAITAMRAKQIQKEDQDQGNEKPIE